VRWGSWAGCWEERRRSRKKWVVYSFGRRGDECQDAESEERSLATQTPLGMTGLLARRNDAKMQGLRVLHTQEAWASEC